MLWYDAYQTTYWYPRTVDSPRPKLTSGVAITTTSEKMRKTRRGKKESKILQRSYKNDDELDARYERMGMEGTKNKKEVKIDVR